MSLHESTDQASSLRRGCAASRRKARRLAMFVVFAHLHTGEQLTETRTLLATMAKSYAVLPEFALELCHAVETHRAEIEHDLQEILEHWRLDRLGRIEHALLLLGAAEIGYFPSIPPRVTINEYLEISKMYCDDHAPGFINGVLDRMVKLKAKRDFFVR